MSSTATKNVAIIGGGILGVSTAVHLLREGASVTLLTEKGLASEATGRSLSWLTPPVNGPRRTTSSASPAWTGTAPCSLPTPAGSGCSSAAG